MLSCNVSQLLHGIFKHYVNYVFVIALPNQITWFSDEKECCWSLGLRVQILSRLGCFCWHSCSCFMVVGALCQCECSQQSSVHDYERDEEHSKSSAYIKTLHQVLRLCIVRLFINEKVDGKRPLSRCFGTRLKELKKCNTGDQIPGQNSNRLPPE